MVQAQAGWRSVSARAWALAAMALVAGIALRAWLTCIAPQHGYFGDHLTNIGFGLTARLHGLSNVYKAPPASNPVMLSWLYPVGQGEPVVWLRQNDERCNYPPLGLTMFWAQTFLLDRAPYPAGVEHRAEAALRACELAPPRRAALEKSLKELQAAAARGAPNVEELRSATLRELEVSLSPDQRRQLEHVGQFMDVQCNTVRSRLAMSLLPLLAEAALLVAVALTVRRLASPKAALAAAAACWLCPPLAMDTSLWGQQDSWALASIMFTLYLLLRRNWVLAGAVLGAGALLKPQGILAVPVVAAAAMLLCEPSAPLGGRVLTAMARCGKALAGFALVFVVLSLPWTLSDGGAWFAESYTENFRRFPVTTAKAFNVWYVDALLSDGVSAPAALDSSGRLLGIAKDTWGKLLAAGALGALAVLAWRRRGRPEMALVVFAAMWLWATFMLPTRVHERYVVLCIPALIVACVRLRWLAMPLCALVVVAAAELSWNIWLTTPAGSFDEARVAQYHQALAQRDAQLPPHMRANVLYGDVLRAARMQYAALREGQASREWALTAASVLSFAMAVFLAARKSHDAPARQRGRGLAAARA
jgi:hypothetical protein